jgi:hypothetical protein
MAAHLKCDFQVPASDAGARRPSSSSASRASSCSITAAREAGSGGQAASSGGQAASSIRATASVAFSATNSWKTPISCSPSPLPGGRNHLPVLQEAAHVTHHKELTSLPVIPASRKVHSNLSCLMTVGREGASLLAALSLLNSATIYLTRGPTIGP